MNKIIESLALTDSGAGGKFIDQNYVKKIGITPQKLDEPLTTQNMDRTPNKKGKITSFVTLNLTINGRAKQTRLLVTGLWRPQIILGFPWLREQNPDINWQTGEFKWQPQTYQVMMKHRLDSMQFFFSKSIGQKATQM